MPDTTAEVKMFNAALDDEDGKIVLRGRLDVSTLNNIKFDSYQRKEEPLTKKTMKGIIQSYKTGHPVDDVVLGMRGEQFRSKDGVFTLKDTTFGIDGRQRLACAKYVLRTFPETKISVGAKLHFGTNFDFEEEMFRQLNKRTAMSPNVILRNARNESPALLTLYGLATNDKKFALHGRVSWEQGMLRHELVTALVLAKTTQYLHAHKAPGITAQVERLVTNLDKTASMVGLNTFRQNLVAFFDLIDEAWGIRAIQYREASSQLKGTFLYTFARVLSDHNAFWAGNNQQQLYIESSLRSKLKQFPIHDPEIIRLCGSGGMARESLYQHLVNHINTGKRTRRLVRREPQENTLHVGA